MKAVQMTGVRHPLELRECPVRDPAAGEVLVRVRATGICHSDAHYRAGPERRRHYRLLLLDAPPATPLRTTQYLAQPSHCLLHRCEGRQRFLEVAG